MRGERRDPAENVRTSRPGDALGSTHYGTETARHRPTATRTGGSSGGEAAAESLRNAMGAGPQGQKGTEIPVLRLVRSDLSGRRADGRMVSGAEEQRGSGRGWRVLRGHHSR